MVYLLLKMTNFGTKQLCDYHGLLGRWNLHISLALFISWILNVACFHYSIFYFNWKRYISWSSKPRPLKFSWKEPFLMLKVSRFFPIAKLNYSRGNKGVLEFLNIFFWKSLKFRITPSQEACLFPYLISL